ncbi:MAG: reverse transcriptase family protein [Oscillospiraceae bacterium]
MNIWYTNADSLINKRQDLINRLNNATEQPHIIAVTEIKPKNLKDNILQSEFNLVGYNCFCAGLDDPSSRGLLIFAKNNIDVSLVDQPSGFKEHIFMKVKCSNNKNLLICNLYRSPSSSVLNDELLFSLIKQIVRNYQMPIVLVGDFNFSNIQWDSIGDSFVGLGLSEINFIKTLRENLLEQHIMKPTRQRGKDTPHILDLIISSGNIVTDIIHESPLGLSDHALLKFQCNLKPNFVNRPLKFKFDKGDFPELNKYFTREWDKELGDVGVNDMWTTFKDIVHDGMLMFIPRSSGQEHNNGKKSKFYPYSKELHGMIRRKHRLWNRWIETKRETIHSEYNKIRNQVKEVSRNLIKQQQDNIAVLCKNNPKKFWQYVKSKSVNNTTVGDLKWLDQNGLERVAEQDIDKAIALEDFFSSVFTEEGDGDFDTLNIPTVLGDMSDLIISEELIKSKLSKLKIDKSPGLDLLHPRVLVECKETLAEPLKLIFTKSLLTGCVPDDWKSAEVVALYKKGPRNDRGNYRPVSLTSVCCKVQESLIRDHIMNFLVKNNLLSNRQYGFIKGRSTMLQLLHMLDKWTTYLEEGGQVDAIYTDFEKAFDKVPHKRLISKLHSYGLNSALVNWIKSFLCNRKQRIRVNGSYSGWGRVTSGIPQGSVLGPILFLLYINDLPDFCEKDSGIYLFADDAKLYKHVTVLDDNNKLQTSLNALQEWSDKWLLKLNINKCKIISFGRNVDDSYKYFITKDQNNIQLVRESNMNDLGVTLDSKLNFSGHIQSKINKAFSMVGLLKRNFSNISVSSFVLLYKSMVRSHLEYCNSVWAPYRLGDIEDIERVQKRATKILPGLKGLSYVERLKKCNLCTLRFRRVRGDMIETYKILTGKYDQAVVPNFIYYSGSNVTRGNSMKINTARTRYDLRKYYFTNRVINIWNSLPNNIVTSDTLNQFKNKLDKFWCNQDMFYNYKSNLTGIGSRSEVDFDLD